MTPDQRTSAFRPDAKTSKEQRKQPKIDLVRVISRAENGTLLGYVPLDLIYEDVPVDDRRVNELADDIERREQREPIVIGYVRDRNRLAIMNGFHRVAAMKELGKDEIFSTIWPDVTWKDVLEHRILATKNQAIQFARLPEWLHELFHEEQKWVKMGITLNQVFGVGNNLRRIPQEIKGEVDEWIKHVVELSGKGKVTLANMLRTANVADPDLMKRSRTGGVGKNKAEGKLNQRKLDAIAAELPYESNFWRQRFVANKALDFNLSLKEISDLSIQMRDVDDLVEAREVFEAFMIEKGLDAVFDTEETPDVPTVRKNGDGKIQPVKPIEEVSVFDARAEKHRDEKLLDLLLEAELRATHEMIKNAAFLGKINPDHVPAAPFIYEQLPPNQVDELLSTLFLEENDEREVDNNGYPGYSANFLGEAWSEERAREFIENVELRRFEMIAAVGKKYGLHGHEAEELMENTAIRMIGMTRNLIKGKLPEIPEVPKRVLLTYVFFDMSLSDTSKILDVGIGEVAVIVGKIKNRLFAEFGKGKNFRNDHYLKEAKDMNLSPEAIRRIFPE